MKKSMLLISLFCSTFGFSQNTFPTNGNVGIGTNSPSERLDVNGNMIIDSSLIVKDSITVEKDFRTKGAFRVEDKAYFFDRVFMYDKLESTEKITTTANIEAGNNANINNNINVGNNINVTNKLEVDGTSILNGNVKVTGLQNLNNLNNPNLEVVFKNQNGTLKTYGVVDFITYMLDQGPLEPAFCTDSVPNPKWVSALNKIYTYCPEVRVGVGTNDPLHKLHTVGVTFSTRIMAGNALANSNAVISGFAINNNYPLLELGRKIGGLSQETRFFVDNNGALTIDNDGANTSITIKNGENNALEVIDNTGNKIFQVQNDGLLRAREIRVDALVWPDYVFEEEYTLMSLNQVESFIQENKHLPNIPSEKEILAKGLNVSDMQQKQMQKIEELTLYLIEMDKKISALEQKMAQLEKENMQLKSEK